MKCRELEHLPPKPLGFVELLTVTGHTRDGCVPSDVPAAGLAVPVIFDREHLVWHCEVEPPTPRRVKPVLR
ncbi:hypothetical protein HNR46_001609 [Haloferula luteola]|uniref:Uncharacterized protein n=1 Tax=Haloferula luteola TaxID=595692 RepID=A0A840V1T7_9BACT|nr:hypothetical protein [Haloferula luteola]